MVGDSSKSPIWERSAGSFLKCTIESMTSKNISPQVRYGDQKSRWGCWAQVAELWDHRLGRSFKRHRLKRWRKPWRYALLNPAVFGEATSRIWGDRFRGDGPAYVQVILRHGGIPDIQQNWSYIIEDMCCKRQSILWDKPRKAKKQCRES